MNIYFEKFDAQNVFISSLTIFNSNFVLINKFTNYSKQIRNWFKNKAIK